MRYLENVETLERHLSDWKKELCARQKAECELSAEERKEIQSIQAAIASDERRIHLVSGCASAVEKAEAKIEIESWMESFKCQLESREVEVQELHEREDTLVDFERDLIGEFESEIQRLRLAIGALAVEKDSIK